MANRNIGSMTIKLKVDMSMWDALKLRVAGLSNIIENGIEGKERAD